MVLKTRFREDSLSVVVVFSEAMVWAWAQLELFGFSPIEEKVPSPK